MKKSLMLLCASLFALGSIVARADHGDRERDTGTSGRGAPTSQAASTPGAGDDQNEHANPDDQNEHANPQAPEDEAQDDRSVLAFGSMVAVDGAFVGNDAIRGFPGAGLPWTLARARGTLRADGRLRIKVRGLVLANDPAVPPAQVGTNPSATFRGLVSCLSEQSGGTGTMTTNVATDPFPATAAGDSDIDGSVTLPAQCIAPIVFVTNADGSAWFAVTGTQTTGP